MENALRDAIRTRRQSHPRFAATLEEILRLYPPVEPAIAWIAEPEMLQCWEEAEEHIGRFLEARGQSGVDSTSLAKAFVRLCAEFIKEQAYLVRHGSYRQSSLDAMVETLYLEHEEMSVYMDGLFLSTFLWKNHYRIFRFYADAFLPGLSLDRNAEMSGIDIGPGHGLFFVLALKAYPKAHSSGLDVSPASLAMTAHLCRAHAVDETRFHTLQHNVKDPLPYDGDRFDYAVAGEVLEHIEDPAYLLSELRRTVRPGGRAFVTTVVNAAARDHIYLFRKEEEVGEMFQRTGWAMEQKLVLEVPLAPFLQQNDARSENCAYILIRSGSSA